MTDAPSGAPLAPPELADLLGVYAALAGRLGEAGRGVPLDDGARRGLREEIAALYRTVDRRLVLLAALQEDVRALAGAWKQLPDAPPLPAAQPVAAPAAAPPPHPTTAMTATRPVADGAASVRIDHLGASTYVAKGWSAISLGDHAAAERALGRALALAPHDPEAGALHAWALAGQGRLDEAEAACGRVLAREPAYALARVKLGYVALRRRAYADAVAHLAAAVRGSGDRKATLYATLYLGLAALHQARPGDAAEHFRRALVLGPNLLQARYELGRALWCAGDRDGACEAWRAGAAAGNLNPWGARCAAVSAEVERGGEPPAVEQDAP